MEVEITTPLPSTAGRRGRKRSLSLTRIAAAALAIADAEGLDVVTMKRVAEELNVAPMTLYGYVRTKEEILAAMTDVAISELPLTGTGTWHQQITDYFIEMYSMLVHHPAVALLNARQPVLVGPTTLPVIERGLMLICRRGLEGAAAVCEFRSLFNFTLGSALFHVGRQGAEALAPLTQRATAWRAADPMSYPTIAALAQELSSEDAASQFETGLDHLLNGISAQTIHLEADK